MKKYFAFVALLLSICAFAQQKKEDLKISLPQEYKWKETARTEDEKVTFVEIIPGKEKVEKWTLLASMLTLRGIKATSGEQVAELYRQSSSKESPDAKLTVLESNDTAKNNWIIFKVETPKFPDDPKPESQLYYAIQGETTLYVSFIAVKEKTLSPAFIEKWTKVFKTSDLVSL